ncbi:MAG TPA: alpha-amylase family glycosyl hydrolase [Opitutaceae bacterium]|nr:alpha-amylase family glycosyl hydrolase [Opitutaceae bacterium]
MSPRLLPFALALACVAASAARAGQSPSVAVPRFTHPGAGQTFYFVLTDRFANGRADNDTGGFPGGTEEHGFDPTRIGYFHGGDLAGLTARLDYLQGLGVTAVWVTPPFQNKPVQTGSAAYHGYWVTDFLRIDPHLGTNEEFRAFVKAAHGRGMKVYMDIIVNHSADVIHFPDRKVDYLESRTHPLRDAAGQPLKERDLAYNGLGDTARPALSAEKSFAYAPVVPDAERTVKNPAWLNDPVHYHNRGNSTFRDESSLHGDFVGLDDTFTELPQVVNGFIDIFSHWVREYDVDGFRIDTARHVNAEFWQAFGPAIRAAAREDGRPGFIQFGEVANEALDLPLLSEFSTHMPLDTTLDFGFFVAARNFVSRGGPADQLAEVFQRDDLYTDHDSNIHSTTTFVGNHDAGRFAYFLSQDNPGAPPALLADLVKLGHGLLLLSRGQPVLYYGDEQGMVGRGGNDMQARESLFASQAPDFRTAPLLATTRTGADDKYDPAHPFYRFFSRLAGLRAAHAALRTGAMVPRDAGEPGVFAFSRIDRDEKVEFVIALNNYRSRAATFSLPTSQPTGGQFRLIFDSSADPAEGLAAVDGAGRLSSELQPLQFKVWRAEKPLGPRPDDLVVKLVNPAAGAALGFSTRETDGHIFPSRQELRAEANGDGLLEVTFVLRRASRPGQYELLGTDDAPPYRVFWRPPPDLPAGEEFSITATATDLRGRVASDTVDRVKVAPHSISFGIRGATTPLITAPLPARAVLEPGRGVTLTIAAEGTGPLEYQWLRDEREIPNATDASLAVTAPGRYAVLVRNRAGTAVSPVCVVEREGTAMAAPGRVVKHEGFPSAHVAPRHVHVWLPPGYDDNPAVRYPVVYMHDGQNLFDPATSYAGVPWSADDAIRRLVAAGRTPGAIIVGVWNTPARFAEYLPEKAVSPEAYGRLVAQFRLRGDPPQGDAYLRFLATELKPFIDRTYRTKPEPRHTSTMGSSMGALISAYAVCERPDVFGGAGCVSIHWPLGEGMVADWFVRHAPRPGTHRLWFDYGTEKLDHDYEPYQRRVDAGLRAAGHVEGRDFLSRKFAGAEHSERAWRERVDQALAFLLRL